MYHAGRRERKDPPCCFNAVCPPLAYKALAGGQAYHDGEGGDRVFARTRLSTNFFFSLILLSPCHVILSQIRVFICFFVMKVGATLLSAGKSQWLEGRCARRNPRQVETIGCALDCNDIPSACSAPNSSVCRLCICSHPEKFNNAGLLLRPFPCKKQWSGSLAYKVS